MPKIRYSDREPWHPHWYISSSDIDELVMPNSSEDIAARETTRIIFKIISERIPHDHQR